MVANFTYFTLKWSSVSIKGFLSYPCQRLLVWDFACLFLKMPIRLFFFPFLFSSIVALIFEWFLVNVIIFARYFMVFNMTDRCINNICIAGESSSSFFSLQIWPVYVIVGMQNFLHRHEFSCFLINLLEFFPRALQEWRRVSYEAASPVVYGFEEISVI